MSPPGPSYHGCPADNIYNSNIQIAEINALNCCLAIIKFKKFFGFYLDLENETSFGLYT